MDSNLRVPQTQSATKSGLPVATPRPPPQVVVLEDPTRRKKNPQPPRQAPEFAKNAATTETSSQKRGRARYRKKKAKVKTPLEQFRLDIKKLGTSGFQEHKRDEINVKLAVKLGAKPPKNRYANYKDVMTKVKEDRIEEKKQREIKRKLGLKVVKPPRKEEEKSKKKGSFSCQIGYYKDGCQHIPKKLVQSLSK